MASGLSRYESKIEAIADHFICFICLGLSVNPHQCVHCGKMACFTCFEQCLKKNYLCPHCRKQLQIQQLRHFGWYADVIENLKALQSSENCSVHSKVLNLYCSDCEESICYKCVVLGENHYGHVLNPLEDVYEQHMKEIKEKVTLLNERLSDILKKMEEKKALRKSSRTKREEKLRADFEDILERFHKKMDEELERFISHGISLDVTAVQDVLGKIDRQLKDSDESVLIRASPSMLEDLEGAKIIMDNFVQPSDIDCPNEIKPLWKLQQFTVTDFAQVLENEFPFIAPSEALEADGWVWRMTVYRNFSDSEGNHYLGVSLKVIEATVPKVSAKLEFVVRMFHSSLETKDFAKTVVVTCDPKVEEFNIEHFYKIDSLSSDGFLDPETDCLNFAFGVRSPTFFEECKKQQLQIDQLLNEKREKDEIIRKLEKKREL